MELLTLIAVTWWTPSYQGTTGLNSDHVAKLYAENCVHRHHDRPVRGLPRDRRRALNNVVNRANVRDIGKKSNSAIEIERLATIDGRGGSRHQVPVY